MQSLNVELLTVVISIRPRTLRVHVKLIRTAKALKNWRRKQFSGWKLSWAIINIALTNIERAQECCLLTADEIEFKKYLKNKALGVAALQKARARQHSRLTWIRKGDTNNRFFQLHANARRKKTFISSLSCQTGTVVTQKEKSKMIHSHFSQIMRTAATRTKAINWQALGYVHHDLEDLDAPFTEEEIATVIKQMSPAKAPGPDEFIGLFYK
jgi:hypothetical protein